MKITTTAITLALVLAFLPLTVLSDEVITDEWNVYGDDNIKRNETIYLNDNLIIKNGGTLKFYNVTLIINCTNSDGEFGIKIENGGIFEIHNSTIKAGAEYKFYINVDSGGEFKIDKSTIDGNFDTGILHIPKKAIEITMLIGIIIGFVIAPIVLFLLYMKFGRPSPPSTSGQHSIIGKEGIVLQKIIPENFKGKVKVESRVWSATSEKEIEQDKKIIVESAEGVHLIVKEKEQN